MSAAHGVPTPSPPPARGAIDLRQRALLAMLALTPSFAAHAWLDRSLAAGIASVLLLASPWLLRAGSDRAGMDGLWFVQRLLLLLLWLPADAQVARACAILVCLALGIAWRGRDRELPFHPLMIACAFALLCFPAAPAALPPRDALVLGCAAGLGGLGLLAGRAIRWQAPVGMLVGGAGVLGIAGVLQTIGGHPGAMLAGIVPVLPAWLLTVFFVADDPPRTCMRPRARLLLGILTGMLALVAMLGLHALGRDRQILLALAGSILLANAAAPTFDRLFASPSRTDPTRA